ncbi:hypothetical protein [Glaciibacter psychrotolerans]|uniref:Short-subunit dehydrogenase n=1 Tax=Glaciibacter psychrotolerans TaxID=670054 RepID=A0A7Z0EBK2_9MICO|nr:short-subunit dehydrogenase [Leifsonia psychrotolerans]
MRTGIARKFGRNGFDAILLARRQEALDTSVAALRQQGIEARGIVADAAVGRV